MNILCISGHKKSTFAAAEAAQAEIVVTFSRKIAFSKLTEKLTGPLGRGLPKRGPLRTSMGYFHESSGSIRSIFS